jgi:hypothetical protein
MKPHRILPFVLISFLINFIGWNTGSAEEAALRVTPTTPDVNIKVRSNDGYAIRLPVLQYEFLIEAVCAAGFMPESVMLSVADTRKRVAAIDLGEGPDASITMRIPAKQIAPLSAEGFCLASDNNNKLEAVTVRGVLSAQASLLCTDDEDQQITYASQSLDVTLSCDTDPAE